MSRLLKGFLTTLILIAINSICFASDDKTVLGIEHWETKNDAHVYYVKATEIPIVDVFVAFQAGSGRDGQFPGIANLTNNLLNQGTTSLNADQIATNFDTVGALYSNQAGHDMSLFTLRSLTKPELLQPALQTFTAVLSQPNFPQDAFLRTQQQTLVAIDAVQQSPSDLADQVFYQQLYGNHPYAHPVLGTTDSIKALTTAEVSQFYKTYYVAKNATVVIVGDVDKSQAKDIAEQVVGQLPEGEAAQALAPVPMSVAAATDHVNYPSEQTHIRIGEVGISWLDPDLIPLYIGNYTLGGGMLVSRLFTQVREQLGLSYTTYSYFQPMAANGPFLIGLQTVNKNAAQASDASIKILDDYVKHGPTKEELQAAKDNIIGGFPLRLDSNANIANYVLMIGFYHLPLNYLDTFRGKVAAVTQDQIKQAFKQHINLDHLLNVSVGSMSQTVVNSNKPA